MSARAATTINAATPELSNSSTAKVGIYDPAVAEGFEVRLPLYQVKAELFRTLGHPVRIRVLEQLRADGHSR